MLAAKVFQESASLRESWNTADSADLVTVHRDSVLFPGSGGLGESQLSVDPTEPNVEQLVIWRACDYFRRKHVTAPLIGWYLALILLLKHSPPEVSVQFDLSGDPRLDDKEDLEEYCRSFWNEARGGLASTARFYGGVFSSLAEGTSDFARAAQFGRLDRLLTTTLEEQDPHKKGRMLEELVANLVEIPGSCLPVLEKRLKHTDEELDLVLRNDLSDSFWANFQSPILIVECKNWRSKVDIGELRILETKIDDRGSMCRIGVFVSLCGFSEPFLKRARTLQSKGIMIFPVDGNDLASLIRSQTTLPNWLKENGLRKLL